MEIINVLLYAIACVSLATSAIVPHDCQIKSADVAFIIDSSGSIDSTEWRQSITLAANMVKSYDIGRDKVRVALIVFESIPRLIFDFNRYTTQAELVSAIRNAPKHVGGTRTSQALDMARSELFQPSRGMRVGVPNIVMVLTDGQSDSTAATLASAKSLHASGVIVIALGVDGASLTELRGIASSPELVYAFPNFDRLAAGQDHFKKESCKAVNKLEPKVSGGNVQLSRLSLRTTLLYKLIVDKCPGQMSEVKMQQLRTKLSGTSVERDTELYQRLTSILIQCQLKPAPSKNVLLRRQLPV